MQAQLQRAAVHLLLALADVVDGVLLLAVDFRLDRFAYAPSEGRLGFVLQMLQGVASYVSGRIAKLAPDSIRLETPAAIIGVRGTTLAINVLPE